MNMHNPSHLHMWVPGDGGNDYELQNGSKLHSSPLQLWIPPTISECCYVENINYINDRPSVYIHNQNILEEQKNTSIYSENLASTWIIKNEIGRGTYGTVYRVEHHENKEFRAMKQVQILPGSKNNPFDEAKILNSLNHPNIVKVYDFSTSSDKKYLNIYMEYISNSTLRDKMRKSNGLSEFIIKRYAKQLVYAVDYLHTNRVIHRDIKPENILLTLNEDLKLVDFGISKFLIEVSCCSSVVGTTQYCSKEILEGKYNRTTDIWSLGCVILEMTTGQLPWPHKHMGAVACAISLGKVPAIPKTATRNLKNFLKKTFLAQKKRPHAEQLLMAPWIQE